MDLAQLEQRVRGNRGLHGDCTLGFTLSQNCRTSDDPTVLLWGDSFAMHLSDALLSDDRTREFIQQTMNSCAPVLGMAHLNHNFSRTQADECISFHDQVFDWLEQNQSVEIVVLSSPFGGLLSSAAVGRDGSVFPLQDRHEPTFLADYIIQTVDKIRDLGRRVVIVSPTPRSGWDIGQCAVRSAMFNEPENICDFGLDKDAPERKLLERVQEQVPVIWLSDMICSDGICDPTQGSTFLYRDYGHLSYEGAAYLGEHHALAAQIFDRAE